jgi:hypothetical protein
MSMSAKLEKGKLIITIDATTENMPASASGKTKVVASSHGNQATSVVIDGKPVIVGLNAYIKA